MSLGWRFGMLVLGCWLIGGGVVQAARQPLSTYSAFPVPVHQVEVQTRLEYVNHPHSNEAFQLALDLNYGLIQHLDVGLEVPFVFWRPGQGENANVVGDVILKGRLLFLKGRAGNPVSLTFLPFLKLPTADEKRLSSLATGEADLGAYLVGTRKMEHLTAHLNLGYLLVGDPPGQSLDNVFVVRVGVETQPRPEIELVGEFTGETNRYPGKDDLISLRAGARYHWKPSVRVDVGLEVGLSQEAPDYRSLVGISTWF